MRGLIPLLVGWLRSLSSWLPINLWPLVMFRSGDGIRGSGFGSRIQDLGFSKKRPCREVTESQRGVGTGSLW
jgi:hypothetical protein